MEQPRMAIGWAARDASGLLSPFSFPLRHMGDEDVVVKILFCGICHSDLSTIKNEWGNAQYPVVPGHEMVGIVTEVGSSVTRFKAGDKVGVGYIASTCRACPNCQEGFENYCAGLVASFNSALPDGAKVHGGFSELAVVHEHFVLRIPDNSPLDRVAPLLCAGVTVYCPMKRLGLDRAGLHLGVAGLGGLGHLAVKFGKAFGMKVTVISTSPGKEVEAVEKLGADEFVLSSNAEQMKAAIGTMDGIIDTVSAVHDLTPLIMLLRTHGKLVPVGSPGKPVQLALYPLQSGGKMVAGSMIGGMGDTQEMIDFAAEHNITAEVEVIGIGDVNAAMERLQRGDVRYRFVIDIANTMAPAY